MKKLSFHIAPVLRTARELLLALWALLAVALCGVVAAGLLL
jgi:hypothetical protein